MYLHLGQETLVKTGDIIGIFDLDTTTISKDTRAFLTKSEKTGRVVNVSMELPKSFVVTDREKVYISQLASATLKSRYDVQIKRRKISDKLF